MDLGFKDNGDDKDLKPKDKTKVPRTRTATRRLRTTKMTKDSYQPHSRRTSASPWIKRNSTLVINLAAQQWTILLCKLTSASKQFWFLTVNSRKQYLTYRIVQWLKWFCEAGGGLTWRSQVGANPIPIPHPPTNLALFGHKITLYRFNHGAARTIAGGSNQSRGLSPLWPPSL